MSERPELRNSFLNGESGALAGGYFVYCDLNSGIYLFPLSGGAALRVNSAFAALPSSFYQAAAFLDGTLFAAVG